MLSETDLLYLVGKKCQVALVWLLKSDIYHIKIKHFTNVTKIIWENIGCWIPSSQGNSKQKSVVDLDQKSKMKFKCRSICTHFQANLTSYSKENKAGYNLSVLLKMSYKPVSLFNDKYILDHENFFFSLLSNIWNSKFMWTNQH